MHRLRLNIKVLPTIHSIFNFDAKELFSSPKKPTFGFVFQTVRTKRVDISRSCQVRKTKIKIYCCSAALLLTFFRRKNVLMSVTLFLGKNNVFYFNPVCPAGVVSQLM